MDFKAKYVKMLQWSLERELAQIKNEGEVFPIKMPDGRGQDGNGVDIKLHTFESQAADTKSVADFVYRWPENTQNVEQLKKLVQSGRASVNTKNNEYRRTALDLAVVKEKVEFVDVLLEAGAKIKQNIKGDTAVHYAVQHWSPENTQHVEQLKKLVQSDRPRVDIMNDKYGRTALHLAVLKKKMKFVDVLLEAGAKIKQDIQGDTAVHYVVQHWSPEKTQHVEQLKKLVQSDRISLNFQNNKYRRTALHLAVLKKKTEFVNVLLEAGAKIKQDVHGDTAVHYAVLHWSPENTQHVEQLKKLVQSDRESVNFQSNAERRTALQWAVLEEKGKFVDVLLEAGAYNEHCVADFVLQRPENTQHVEQLKKLVQSGRTSVNIKNNKDGRTALHWAVLKEKVEFVDVLLEAGAKIKQDVDENTAVHYAVQYWSPENTQHVEQLKKLVQSDRAIVNYQNRDGRIALHLAVLMKNAEIVDVLLEAGAKIKQKIVEYIVREFDLSRLTKLLRNNTGRTGSSPFRELITEMPDIAKEVMDKCVTKLESSIVFNYEFLDDTFCRKYWPKDPPADYMDTGMSCEEYTISMKEVKDNHPLKHMIKGRRTKKASFQQLLDHPLVMALVRRKWKDIGIKFHLLNLAFYLIYLAVLTVCVSTTVPPYVHSQSPSNPFTYRNTTVCQNVTLCQNETSCQNGNACKNTTVCHDTTTCLNKTTTEAAATKITCHSFESHSKSMIVDLQYFVIALSLIMILKEVYQLVNMYGCDYFKQIENYVEIAVYLFSLLFVVNITDCENTDYRTEWQWVFGTFSVFMAWINLLAFAKKFDRLGIYAMMLGSIIKTFLLNVFPIVAVLLMAFAIAFTCVHQDQMKFANVWHSILTTTSFMISGFDYEEFLSLVNYHDIAFVSYIIYSLFQFLMTIVIINLMVSVAVENVQEIHKDASEMNTVLQIEYFLEFEGILWFITSKLRNICRIKKFEKWLIREPKDIIFPTKHKSNRLPWQQINDVIDRNKAKDKQGDFLERMKLTELTSIKDELLSIKTMLTKMTNKEN